MKSDAVDAADSVPSKQSTLIAENIVRDWRRAPLVEADVSLVLSIAAALDRDGKWRAADGTIVYRSYADYCCDD